MSRVSAFSLSVLSALIAAAITAGAFLAVGSQPDAEPTNNPANIVNDQALTPTVTHRPAVPSMPPADGEPAAAPLDWAAAYDKAAPSLVSVLGEAGAGSGFFVSEDGHVITNLHVVDDNSDLQILTYQGDWADAELIAQDAGNDLALLKVDPQDVQIVVPAFADPEDVRVGVPVGAIGTPFDLANTLTVGIVSGLDRDRSNTQSAEPLRGTIQTDAALNPGNSGGMLIDSRGRVVGVPVQNFSDDRAASGIGFAISVGTLLKSLPIMLEGQDVERTFLGVSLDEENGQLIIRDVFCDSSADRAGLRAGDQLVAVNDQPADTVDELVAVLGSITPGEAITITVQRRSRQLELETTAQAWPTTPLIDGCG